MRIFLLRLLAAIALLVGPRIASADHLRTQLLLTARLSGAQEVPAVTTAAQGVAAFTLNETRDTLFVQAAFSGLSGAITLAHVHDGAVGVAGPPVTSLMSMVRGNRLSGYLTGADIVPAKLAKYLRGGYYINVHTAANGGGEIRGQIRLESEVGLVSALSGDQQVPAVTTTAGALGIFTLSQNLEKLKFRVTIAGLSSAITLAHFHIGAFGATGAPVVDLLPYVMGNVIEGEIVPTADFLTALSQGNIYINVHTTNNPGGEIRGQLDFESGNLPFDSRLDGNQMVPVNPSTGKALAVGRLSPTLDSMTVFVSFAGLSGAPTGISVYATPAGTANGTPLGTLAIPKTFTGNIAGFSFTGLTDPIVNAFLRGEINLVINTSANPNGEVRGQLLRLAREGYTIALNGAQERPTPTTSAGYGVGIVSIDRDQSNAHFMSVWGGLSGAPVGGHFHTGLTSQSGPVVFTLTPFFDNATAATAAYGYWKNDNTAQPFTLRRSLQFRGDSVYMNLHTAAFPSGEIRGQVYRGARNLQVVLATQPAAIVAETFGSAPNPFSSAFTLAFEARATGTGQFRVTDVLGREVARQSVAVRAGANALPLALPGLSPGMYLLMLQVGDTQLTTRISKE